MVGGDGGSGSGYDGGGGGDYSSDGGDYGYDDSDSESCDYAIYTFSKKKLASWLCINTADIS